MSPHTAEVLSARKRAVEAIKHSFYCLWRDEPAAAVREDLKVVSGPYGPDDEWMIRNVLKDMQNKHSPRSVYLAPYYDGVGIYYT